MVSEYLVDLANKSGISLGKEIDDAFVNLKKWDVVKEDEYKKIHERLDYEYLGKTIERLLLIDDGLSYIEENNWIKESCKEENYVSKEEANVVIDKAVNKLNNPETESYFEIDEKDVDYLNDYELIDNSLKTNIELNKNDIVYLEKEKEYKKIIDTEDDKYYLGDPELDEILNKLEISGSKEIDFENAEIIPYFVEEKTNYVNNNFELLASNRRTFNKDGFRVSYSVSSSGLDVRISKELKESISMFFDISLSNIKPTYKWNYQNGDVKESFFKINYRLTNELGVSTGKYGRYYLDFKDLDSSSFLNAIKSSIKTKEDEIECTIPICQIKTPIPELPTANFNIDVVAKTYVSGRVELVFYNSGAIGFETRNGNMRVIKDVQKDDDIIVGASARAVAGINFNLEAAKKRLMDVEFDGGVRAAVSSTIHLYDEEGNKKEVESDIPYSVLQEVSKENNNVRICGDLSLNWVLDVQFNTSKALLYKYGLTYKKSILDSNDQVFSNLTHIENWAFVKKCTRKNRNTITTKNTTMNNNNEKIILNKYSAVVIKGKDFNIPISSLPNGYTKEDLEYESSNLDIASCVNGIVFAKEIGSTKIDIRTKDKKYSASINILVSTG